MIKTYIKSLYCLCRLQKEIFVNTNSVIDLKTIEINNICFQLLNPYSIFIRGTSRSGYFYDPKNENISTDQWIKVNSLYELIKKYINDNIKIKNN